MTRQSPNAPRSNGIVRRPPRFLGTVAAILALAGCLFAALVVLWLGQTSQHITADGARGIVIRAVLRADADNVTAENVAQRIRQRVPDLEIEVITETMGRSLMALQEPWIAQMPDFEVTPLPVLLEIHHPALLTHPEQVTQFVRDLEKEPEVEFVAYNETAHDRLVKLATATSSIQEHTKAWLLSSLALAAFLIALSWGAYQGPALISSVVILTIIGWALAFALAWLGFKGWESGAMQTGEWKSLTISLQMKLALGSVVITLTAAFGGRALAWRRP